MPDHREAARELIYRTCMALDAEDFSTFMSLCTPSFQYRITAYSPEIQKEMTWLDQDFEGMRALLGMVPQHLKRLGTLKRHVSVYTLVPSEDVTGFAVTSSFIVTHTDPEGASRLFAAGNYLDEIDTSTGKPLLASRRAHLESRDLGIGSHIPL